MGMRPFQPSPGTPKVLVLGREPAVLVGFIESVIALIVAFQLGLDAEHASLVMAVVSSAFAVYMAWVIKDTLLGASVQLMKAALALAAGYGLDLSEQQQGAVLALIPVTFALWQRTQSSPVLYPIDPSPTQVVSSPPEVAADIKEEESL